MKKLTVIIASVILSFSSFSQENHFAQSSQTPLFINPGSAGVLMAGKGRQLIIEINGWAHKPSL